MLFTDPEGQHIADPDNRVENIADQDPEKKNIADPGSDRKKQLCGLGSIEKKCCGSRSREEKALRIRILGKKQNTDQDLEKKKHCESRSGFKNLAAPDPDLRHDLLDTIYLITVFYFVFFEGCEVLQSFPLINTNHYSNQKRGDFLEITTQSPLPL